MLNDTKAKKAENGLGVLLAGVPGQQNGNARLRQQQLTWLKNNRRLRDTS